MGITTRAGSVIGWAGGGSSDPTVDLIDTCFSRVSANVVQLGMASYPTPDASGQLNLKKVVLTDFGSTPTSSSGGGTAGTVGEIVQHSGVLYFCSATGAAGSATWNVITMTLSA